MVGGRECNRLVSPTILTKLVHRSATRVAVSLEQEQSVHSPPDSKCQRKNIR